MTLNGLYDWEHSEEELLRSALPEPVLSDRFRSRVLAEATAAVRHRRMRNRTLATVASVTLLVGATLWTHRTIDRLQHAVSLSPLVTTLPAITESRRSASPVEMVMLDSAIDQLKSRLASFRPSL